MTEVRIIRHSKSDYPNDALTLDGINYAKEKAPRFRGFDVAIASSKFRAQQTMSAIGYSDHIVEPKFTELEIKSIKASSAHEYVIQAHDQHPSLISETSQTLLEALSKLSNHKDQKILIVSHNLALSSLLYALSGNIDSFEFLDGLNLNINNNGKTQIDSLFKV